MLIRSQDKRKLINFSTGLGYLLISENCSKKSKSYEISCNDWEIAQYSTEEKALKVLDMIEAEYRKYLSVVGGPSLLVGGTDIQPAVYNIPKTFQMPTDKELDEPTSQTIIDDINKMHDELKKEAPNAKAW